MQVYTGCIYIGAEHLMLDDHAQCTRAVYAFLKKIRFEDSIWLKWEYAHTAKRYEAFSFLNETYGLFFFYFSIFNWVTEEFEFFLIREVKAY